MFKRILVPLDGSKRAEQALPVAARLAKAGGGSLLLLRVVNAFNEMGMYSAGAGAAVFLQEALDKEATEATAYLAQTAHALEVEGIQTRIAIYSGQAAPYILDVAREQDIDLIVLCSHGYTGFKRWALGSVAQKVTRHSTIPVLVLRQGWPLELPDHGIRPLRIMVTLDGSALAESALLPAAHLSAALSAPHAGELHLVRVLPFSTAFDYGQEDAMAKLRREKMQEAQSYLQEMTRKLTEQSEAQLSVQVSTAVATSIDTAETLISIAETGEGEGMPSITSTCDILALATHGRGGPARWVLGSITERILGATRLPLLIVRPKSTGKLPGEAESAG